MKITFLGAAQTVTGSRILFEHKGYTGLLDCGLFQGTKELRNRNWQVEQRFEGVQSIILTHAHIDHCGYLPRLYKNGFRGNVYCSKPTADLLHVMLLDSARLQVEDANYANKTHHSRHDPALPLYDELDARNACKLVRAIDWNQHVQLNEDIHFSFYRSGHILGSSFVKMEYSTDDGSKSILFSGDLGPKESTLLLPPEAIAETNTLVVESTYGNRSVDRKNVLESLQHFVSKIIQRGGTLVIPAFSLGRAQDLIYLLGSLKKSKKIPDVKIYLDSPMSQKITEIYQRHTKELKPEITGNGLELLLAKTSFTPVENMEDSLALVKSDEPKIVVSASGMLQGGRILHHLKAKLPDEKSGVLFVGFQSAGTKGRLIKDGIGRIRIHHQDIPIHAEIFSIDGLSAHADSDELMSWLSGHKKPPQFTFINHGEKEASDALAYRIKHELQWKHVLVPEDLQTFSV